jgi:hypothetical protein
MNSIVNRLRFLTEAAAAIYRMDMYALGKGHATEVAYIMHEVGSKRMTPTEGRQKMSLVR